MLTRVRFVDRHSRRGAPILATLVVAFLFLSATPGQAQDWQLQAPWPTSHDIHGLCLLSANEAWLVGSGMLSDGTGSVMHTVDGGVTWTLTLLTTTQINAIYFVDPQHGWIVGNDTFRTIDGGASWIHVNSWGTLEDVFFVDQLHGWGCGNGAVTYRTTDGGVTWNAIGPIGGWTLREIYFVDELNGWTADIGGSIYHTTDGGLHWAVQFSDAGASNLGSVQFFDTQEGWVVGGDHFYHTTNGGTTWKRKTVPAGTWAMDARFAPDRLNGVAVGYFGNVVRTTDGGTTWTTVFPASGRPTLWRVRMWDDQRGFEVGDAAMLYTTADGGASWTNRQSGGWAMAHRIEAWDDARAWAACEGGEILRTTDGVFWDRVFTPGIDIYGSVSDVSFVDPANGYAVGKNEQFSGSDCKVLRSTDGGASWQVRAVFNDIFGLDRVETLTPTSLIVLGDIPGTGGLGKSTDSGATWTSIVPPGAGDISGLDFVSPLVGWTAGDRIYGTADGGSTWVQQLVSPGFFIDISMADAQNGWAVGAPGLIVHTSNGGATWVTQNSGITASLFAVSAMSATEAWAAVLGGSVLHTTDGGATWSLHLVDPAPSTNFTTIAFTSTGRGWVGGNMGIWHLGSATSVAPAAEIGGPASSIAMLPAGPNPFAAQTRIRFRLAEPGPVSLTIFDVSGRRVRALIDADRQAGEDEAWWDGRDDAGTAVKSGVYFARLEAARASVTERLLLVH